MSAGTNILINTLSGLNPVLNVGSSHGIQLVLLCGISGTQVQPLRTDSIGTLLVSGPQ